LFGLAAINFLNFLAFQVLPAVFVLYANYRFGWEAAQVGVALGLVGASNIVVQGVLVRRVIARIGERSALLVGLFFGSASFVLYGLAPNDIVFLAAVFLWAPIGFVGPALQGFMTRRVSPAEQGQLQGANSSILGLTGVIGPGLFTITFASFIGTQVGFQLPGAPFLLAALLMAGALMLASRVTRMREAQRLGLEMAQGLLNPEPEAK
jgi:DHA1 family tetracycline resistance protein-like MFS transporter